MASAALGKELECFICLTLYTNPVTLSCGHNFCQVCIDQHLSTQDGSGAYSCPECRAEFQEQPALIRSMTLCNIVENFRSSQPKQEEDQICCTYCVDFPVSAVRSCLMCEASLCDIHLKVHSKGAEHVLTEPSTHLGNRKCSVHKELLKYYCTKDGSCICVSCSLAGKHRGHRVEILDEASEKKKKKLRNVLKKLMTKREKTEERVQSLEELRRKAEEKASGEAERVTALFIDIRRRLDDLEKRVRSEVSRQEEEVSLSSSALIQQLEIKKDELSRKMRHIEGLCNMVDPLTVLQDPDTGDLCDSGEEGTYKDTKGYDGGDGDTGEHDEGEEDTKGHAESAGDTEGHNGGDEDNGAHDGGDEDTGGHDKTHDVDVDVITGMLHAGLSDIMTHLQTISTAKPKAMRPQPQGVRCLPSHTQDLPVSGAEYGGKGVIVRTGVVRRKVTAAGEGGIYGKGPVNILLDVNTAANYLLISDDLKTATQTLTNQNSPETAERFQGYYQVMSRREISSGRHYWDVEISGAGLWRVGMCYPSIDRRGQQSYIGNNNKSWCLQGEQWGDNQLSVIYDSEEIRLPHKISSDRVRICLDYEAGQLSFYDLCDPIRHLHTVTATFTEPLHAVLCVWAGCIKILGGSRKPLSSEKSPRRLVTKR